MCLAKMFCEGSTETLTRLHVDKMRIQLLRGIVLEDYSFLGVSSTIPSKGGIRIKQEFGAEIIDAMSPPLPEHSNVSKYVDLAGASASGFDGGAESDPAPSRQGLFLGKETTTKPRKATYPIGLSIQDVSARGRAPVCIVCRETMLRASKRLVRSKSKSSEVVYGDIRSSQSSHTDSIHLSAQCLQKALSAKETKEFRLLAKNYPDLPRSVSAIKWWF